MSWLEDIPRNAVYKCDVCDHAQTETYSSKDFVEKADEIKGMRVCEECGGQSFFAKIASIKLNVRSLVAIENNGRKGYVSTDGHGRPTYISATKMHYIKTGNVKAQYTKGYEEHLRQRGQGHILEETTKDEIIEQRKKNKELSKKAKKITEADYADIDAKQ